MTSTTQAAYAPLQGRLGPLALEDDSESGLRRMRARLTVEELVRLLLAGVFYWVVAAGSGSGSDAGRGRLALALAALIVLPGLVFKAWHWRGSRQAVVEMGSSGGLTAAQISRLLSARGALREEIAEAKPYLDVMRGQMSDSLAESEREVVKVIEELGLLSTHAAQKRGDIARSIQSGKALTEKTCSQVAQNHETIGALRAQLEGQTGELRVSFQRMQTLGGEVCALAPLIKVITSIAQQTSLLALNAEIEAARAGQCGSRFLGGGERGAQAVGEFNPCRGGDCDPHQHDLRAHGHRTERGKGGARAARGRHQRADADWRVDGDAGRVLQEQLDAAGCD